MHTMKLGRSGSWEVGYYEPNETNEGSPVHYWTRLALIAHAAHAAELVSYLNGGPKPVRVGLLEMLGT